ncbi:MAG: DUF1573 domain-containing protein [Chthoniobacterales bacterium]
MPETLCCGMNLTAKAILMVMCLGASASARAELSWEKTQIDLSPKATDAEAVANFKYENKGTKPIKITSVKSSCGCTVASLKKELVEPGEKGEVTATFKIGGRTGVQQKAITVTTDDPNQPVINLMLKADIPVALEMRPTFVYWENGVEPTPKKIEVKAGKDVELSKLEVTSSAPDFKTSVEKGAAPGEYTITVTPTQTKQMVNATLTLKSNLPQSFFATARVTGPAAPATTTSR